MSSTSNPTVLEALRRGRERSAEFEITAEDGAKMLGSVAVVCADEAQFIVKWVALRSDSINFDEADDEGTTVLSTVR